MNKKSVNNRNFYSEVFGHIFQSCKIFNFDIPRWMLGINIEILCAGITNLKK